MTRLRITLTALVLATLGVAQASEITQFPLEQGTRSRAEVQAEARAARAAPGELYDGSHLSAKAAMQATTKSREDVRMEARVAGNKVIDAAARNDLVGGM